jgi:alpha-galactosidase
MERSVSVPVEFTQVDEVEVGIPQARVHEHGWQSWSPTATYAVTQQATRPEHEWQQLMRFRPQTPAPAQGFQGEGLLVLDPGTSEPLRVYAAGDPARCVPSIRAQLVGEHVLVGADGPVTVALADRGGPHAVERALAAFGDRSAQQLRAAPPRQAPTVWCSWYHYYQDVTEADVLENVDAVAELDLPVDVVQLDGGWEPCVGDWLGLSSRFRSLRDLVSRIRATGRRAGIWVAPFTVGSRSTLAREHPDWLIGSGGSSGGSPTCGGTNWNQALYGLDVTHPGAQDYLRAVFERLITIGFDYFKLDFLYTGALRGSRYGSTGCERETDRTVDDGVVAYRTGLQLVRDVVGDAYVVGCGAPILPSVGLLDAMRVSPDVVNPSDQEPGSARLRGEPGTVARAWQHGRYWVNDSDCLIARPSFRLRQQWAAVVERYGGLRSSSDRIADLDEWGLRTTRRLLADPPPPTPFADLS